MKSLYITDLDGTLLTPQQTLSTYTKETINHLINTKQILFSYATARSLNTALQVTKGLHTTIPVIVYNGAFIVDANTKEILTAHYFTPTDITYLKQLLISYEIPPIIYSIANSTERFSYDTQTVTSGMHTFIDSRKGDYRNHPLSNTNSLYEGDIFYISCINEEDKLTPLYHILNDQYPCIFQRDIYTNDCWLEILPKNVSKANAILELKEQLGCTHITSFGDGKNDISMFEISDTAYAMENAVSELKAIATATIASNQVDSVAKWLLTHTKKEAM